MNYQSEFESIARAHIKRYGIDDLLNYLAVSDFYESPASTKYHGAYAHGLVMHSINVFNAMVDFMTSIIYRDADYLNRNPTTMESIAIVSLFHDLCKVDKYRLTQKNMKDPDTGEWYQADVYIYNQEQFRLGHGAASVYTIQKYLKLTDEEAQAIYWHMGAFDISQYSSVYDLGDTYNRNVLAFSLHMADMIATYVDENDELQNKLGQL